MNQSRIGSLIETVANIVVGFAFNYALNMAILPIFFGHRLSLRDNFVMGCVFTFFSVIRTYSLRRWFNGPLKTFIDRHFPA